MRPSSILRAMLAAMVFASHSVKAADILPPKLESWTQYPREVNVTDQSAEVYAEFRVTDNESRIDTPSLIAESEVTSQNTSWADVSIVSSSDDGLDVTYRAVLTIPKGSAPGPWKIVLFPMSDALGNTQYGFGPVGVGIDPTFTVVEDEPAEESTLQVTLEEPAAGLVHMGVGNLRGWAVSSVGIRKVEAYLDGEFLAEIPYGGTRGDVGAVFPDISGSRLSGFSMSLNYSGLSAGSHTLEIIAESIDNKTMSSSVEFQTIRFDSEFIGPGEVIDLNTAASVLSGDEIRVENISIAGKSYNLLLRWRTAEQGFEIVELEPLD